MKELPKNLQISDRGRTPEISQERASILASDADGWIAYARGICHSNNPVENIEFEMKSMAAGTARSDGITYFNSGIAPNIAAAEKEAAKLRVLPTITHKKQCHRFK